MDQTQATHWSGANRMQITQLSKQQEQWALERFLEEQTKCLEMERGERASEAAEGQGLSPQG